MSSVVGKIYSGILVEGAHRVTGGLINKQGGFRAGRECVDQNFTLKQIDEKAQEKKCRVYVGFTDLEILYDRVNRKILWQALRMYDGGGKLLSGIKNMYVNHLASDRVIGSRIDIGVRQGCIISPWLSMYKGMK